MRRSLAALAAPDLLRLAPQDAPEDAVVAEVVTWLREHSGWLLILDNVDSDEAAAVRLEDVREET